MAKAIKTVDVSALPQVVRLAEEVRDTQEPRLLRRKREALVILRPIRSSRRLSRRGKPTTASDPLWKIVGLDQSSGPTDISDHKHKYLAQAYAAETE